MVSGLNGIRIVAISKSSEQRVQHPVRTFAPLLSSIVALEAEPGGGQTKNGIWLLAWARIQSRPDAQLTMMMNVRETTRGRMGTLPNVPVA